jgi:hypothetical protein
LDLDLDLDLVLDFVLVLILDREPAELVHDHVDDHVHVIPRLSFH